MYSKHNGPWHAHLGSYAKWRDRHIADLTDTITPPDCDPEPEWTRIRSFPPGVPGADEQTGDTWYKAECEGITIYRLHDGARSVYFGPAEMVYRWCRSEWERLVERLGEADAARRILLQATPLPHESIIDWGLFKRLVEAEGIDSFLSRAQEGEWLIADDPTNPDLVEWQLYTAQLYNLSHSLLSHLSWERDISAVQSADPNIDSLWRHPASGAIYARTTEGAWVRIEEVRDSIQHFREEWIRDSAAGGSSIASSDEAVARQ